MYDITCHRARDGIQSTFPAAIPRRLFSDRFSECISHYKSCARQCGRNPPGCYSALSLHLDNGLSRTYRGAARMHRRGSTATPGRAGNLELRTMILMYFQLSAMAHHAGLLIHSQSYAGARRSRQSLPPSRAAAVLALTATVSLHKLCFPRSTKR